MSSVFYFAESASGDEVERVEAEYRRIGMALVMARRHKNSSLPISRLPDEILSLIFEECFRSQGSTRRRTDQTPLNVAAVSARWRKVALSCPLIWSRIDFFIRENAPCVSRRATFELLEEVLLRSKNFLIRVDLHDLCDDDPDDVSDFSRACFALSRNAFRCQSLAFHVETGTGVERFYNEFQIEMPILQELALFHTGNPMNTLAHLSLPTCLPIRTHSLKSLTLSQVGLLLDDTQLVLEELRSLKLCDTFIRSKAPDDGPSTHIREPMHLNTLGKARKLETLEIQSLRDWEEWEEDFWNSTNPETTLGLRNLRTLSITVRPAEDVTYLLLSVLEAPRLQKLVIALDPSADPSAGTVPLFFEHVPPSGDLTRMYSLQEVCLTGCSFGARPPWLLEFLSGCPSLKILRMRSCKIGTLAITNLESCTSDGVPTLCPLLTTIELDGVVGPDLFAGGYTPFTFHSLLRMVRARYHAGHPIVDLSLSEGRFSPPTTDDPSEPTRVEKDKLLAEYVSNVHWCA